MRVVFLVKTSKKTQTLASNWWTTKWPICLIFYINIEEHYSSSCFKKKFKIKIFERDVAFLLIFFQQITSSSPSGLFSRLKLKYIAHDNNYKAVFLHFYICNLFFVLEFTKSMQFNEIIQKNTIRDLWENTNSVNA